MAPLGLMSGVFSAPLRGSMHALPRAHSQAPVSGVRPVNSAEIPAFMPKCPGHSDSARHVARARVSAREWNAFAQFAPAS